MNLLVTSPPRFTVYCAALAITHCFAPTATVIIPAPPELSFVYPLTYGSTNHVIQTLSTQQNQTFSVDYNCNCFRMDGEPFRYIAGVMHYYKVPRQYWQDRLSKMKAARISVLQTYVAWNLHEPFEGVYDFDDMHDLVGYLRLAEKLGFFVILRPGPFINNELDLGGLPFWLMHKNASVRLRTSDTSYTLPVRRWLNVLLPQIRPLLYINGGNILSIQIENEYGYHDPLQPCNKSYPTWLREEFIRHLGPDVAYFTVDAPNARAVECGKIENTLVTLDFSGEANASKIFDSVLRPVQPHGPAVNTEFHTGFGQRWGGPAQTSSAERLVRGLRETMEYEKYSCAALYMFEGGTNFGFSAGSYKPEPVNVTLQTIEGITTSFDFNGVLTENGDVRTELFYLLREIINQYAPPPANRVSAVPPNIPRVSYGSVAMKRVATLFDNFERISGSNANIWTTAAEGQRSPPTFEEMLLNYGFALYQHEITPSLGVEANESCQTWILSSRGVRDRAIVFVDQSRKGILSRILGEENYQLALGPLKSGQRLNVLVENQGRLAFLVSNDRRGLAVGDEVTLNGQPLQNWTVIPIPLNDSTLLTNNFTFGAENKLASTEKATRSDNGFVPGRYDGYFKATMNGLSPHSQNLIDGKSYPADTFLRMDTGWGKGVAFVNGRNLGRYWPLRGRQMTLFVPGVWLKQPPLLNQVVLFEVEHSPEESTEYSFELKTVNSSCLNFPKC